MIVEEIINTDLVRRYSDDKTKKLHKIGTEEYYLEAVDLISSPYQYEEVDRPAEELEELDGSDPE